MPILELDLFYAAIDKDDKFHKVGRKVLKDHRQRKIRGLKLDALSLHELELNLKAGNILIDGTKASTKGIAEFFAEVKLTLAAYRLKLFPLTADQIVIASELRDKFGLSFYDSHHAASAMLLDSKIVSNDKAYDLIPQLTRIAPQEI